MRPACRASGRAPRCPSNVFASRNPGRRCDGPWLLGRARARPLHRLSPELSSVQAGPQVHAAPASLLARLYASQRSNPSLADWRFTRASTALDRGVRWLAVEHCQGCPGRAGALVPGQSHDALPRPMPRGADCLATGGARGAAEPSGLARHIHPSFGRQPNSFGGRRRVQSGPV